MNHIVKKITAVMLTAVLCCTAFAGCGKGSDNTDTKSNKKNKSGIVYTAQLMTTLNYSVYDVTVVDGVLYGDYSSYNEDTDTSECGMIAYDFAADEIKTAVLEKASLPDLYVSSYYVDANGQIYIHAEGSEYTAIESDNVDEYNYTYKTQEVDYVYDSDLNPISKTEGEITEETETDGDSTDEAESNEYIYNIVTLKDGRHVVYGGVSKADSEEEFVKVTDADDKELGRIPLGSFWGGSMSANGDDVVLCLYGDSGTEIYRPDLTGFSLGDPVCKLDDSFYGDIYGGADGTLVCNQEGYFTSIDLDKGEPEKLFKFLDCDINPDNVSSLFTLADGTPGAIVNDYDNDTTDIYTFIEQDADQVTVKTELHLATAYADSQLQARVIEFNKQNEQYRIVVDAYLDGDFEEESDYEDALKRLNAAVASGDGPDIIDLSAVDSKQMMQKGVLENLLPYMEADEEIKPEIFVESILNAYKTGDALYAIPTDFSLVAYAGATSQVGTETGWTMQEFLDFAKSLPQGAEIINELTSDGLLQTMLFYNTDEYIDWSTGECSFNTQDFIDLLEFCGNYQSSEDYYADYDYDNEASEITKIRNKQVALQQMYLYDFSSYLLAKETFGEPVTVKGMPVSEGNGIVINSSGTLLGMNAKSEHKDVVWEFIRSFYSEESQSSWNISGFPVRKDCLEKKLKDETVDNSSDGVYTTWGYSDIEIEIPYPTDEDVNEILALIDKADTVADLNYEIYSMVSEETAAFFEGQKSAAEVADIIQSRVTIYVKENR